jgi:hypothetical protein
MLRKRSRVFVALWVSLLLAAPASATIQYVFTSDDGSFTFNSPTFFEGGDIPGPGGKVLSHSANLDAVRFGDSGPCSWLASPVFASRGAAKVFGARGADREFRVTAPDDL